MIKHIGTKTINTKRLTLRKITVEDTEDFFKMCSKPSVSKYVTWNTHKNIEITRAVVENWVNSYNRDRYLWAIEYNGKVIGNIDVVRLTDGNAELGWMLDKPYWNREIMTEAASAVRDYLFNRVNIDALECAHVDKNIGSGRVMQKIGMIFSEYRTFDDESKPKLSGQKLAVYTLTREEWEKI